MALITSAATGNFSAGATWTGGVVPTVGDEARASTGHTVTIDVDTTCDEVSNAGTGIFTLASGVTLTANVTNKSTTTSRNCLQFTAASPAVGYIVGNIVGGGSGTNAISVALTGSGTLNITGNVTAGTSAQASAIVASGAGIVNITGNVTSGSGASSHGAHVTSATGTINITGNVTGGSGGAAAQNQSTGTLNITGAVTGGSGAAIVGAQNQVGGTLSIVGIATGGSGGAGANNQGNGTIFLTRAKGNAYGPGNTSGLAATVGASNVGLGIIEIQELEFGTNGMNPASGTGIRLKKLSSNVAVFNYCDTAGAKTLVDATTGQMPAATDVRDGVSYASGALTGTCAVPAAASVGFGVPVDATTGTAVLTPAAIRSELSVELGRIDAAISSRLAPSGTLATVTTLTNAPTSVTPTDIWTHATRTITGGTVDTLTNAPTVPTAAAIADEVRVELATELGRIDAPVSSASAPTASTVATAVRTELTAELAKVSALNTDRLAQVSTVATTGSQLAAALS